MEFQKKKKDFFSRCSNHVTSGHTQKSSEVYLISFHRPVLCLHWLLVVPAAQHLHLRKSILILHFTSGTAQIYSTPTSASPSTCYHGFKDTYHSIWDFCCLGNLSQFSENKVPLFLFWSQRQQSRRNYTNWLKRTF